MAGVDVIENQRIRETGVIRDKLGVGAARLERQVFIAEGEDARRFNADDERSLPDRTGQHERYVRSGRVATAASLSGEIKAIDAAWSNTGRRERRSSRAAR